MGFGRSLKHGHELDYDELKRESDQQVQDGRKIGGLGAKYLSDKERLEAKIQDVQNSNLSENNKNKLIAELQSVITTLQDEYETEIVEEQDRIQENLQNEIQAMQEAMEELVRQAESLRNEKFDVGSTDISAAADTADSEKERLDTLKSEYTEQLKNQVEQAEIQRRNMRNKRFGGR